MIKEAGLHNVGKIVSSTNDAQKIEQLHVKNEIRLFFNTTHKNMLKVIKNLNIRPDAGEKHKQNSLA